MCLILQKLKSSCQTPDKFFFFYWFSKVISTGQVSGIYDISICVGQKQEILDHMSQQVIETFILDGSNDWKLYFAQ